MKEQLKLQDLLDRFFFTA